ncbi:MAG: DUF3489 domain-containing protein [Hyphomicrobiales bacterium]
MNTITQENEWLSITGLHRQRGERQRRERQRGERQRPKGSLSLSELVRYVREGGDENLPVPPAPSECARADGRNDTRRGEDRPAEDRAVTRKGSKQEMVIAILHEPDGASLEELRAATGWQRHTIRGAISGTIGKKLGFTVTREKQANGELVYRIKGASK